MHIIANCYRCVWDVLTKICQIQSNRKSSTSAMVAAEFGLHKFTVSFKHWLCLILAKQYICWLRKTEIATLKHNLQRPFDLPTRSPGCKTANICFHKFTSVHPDLMDVKQQVCRKMWMGKVTIWNMWMECRRLLAFGPVGSGKNWTSFVGMAKWLTKKVPSLTCCIQLSFFSWNIILSTRYEVGNHFPVIWVPLLILD